MHFPFLSSEQSLVAVSVRRSVHTAADTVSTVVVATQSVAESTVGTAGEPVSAELVPVTAECGAVEPVSVHAAVVPPRGPVDPGVPDLRLGISRPLAQRRPLAAEGALGAELLLLAGVTEAVVEALVLGGRELGVGDLDVDRVAGAAVGVVVLDVVGVAGLSGPLAQGPVALVAALVAALVGAGVSAGIETLAKTLTVGGVGGAVKAAEPVGVEAVEVVETVHAVAGVEGASGRGVAGGVAPGDAGDVGVGGGDPGAEVLGLCVGLRLGHDGGESESCNNLEKEFRRVFNRKFN